MKHALIVFFILASQLMAADLADVQVVRVADKNNESVAGAKVELLGTGKVYYTNSRGECYIPVGLFRICESVRIECISYKPSMLRTFELNSKIILDFR